MWTLVRHTHKQRHRQSAQSTLLPYLPDAGKCQLSCGNSDNCKFWRDFQDETEDCECLHLHTNYLPQGLHITVYSTWFSILPFRSGKRISKTNDKFKSYNDVNGWILPIGWARKGRVCYQWDYPVTTFWAAGRCKRAVVSLNIAMFAEKIPIGLLRNQNTKHKTFYRICKVKKNTISDKTILIC